MLAPLRKPVELELNQNPRLHIGVSHRVVDIYDR